MKAFSTAPSTLHDSDRGESSRSQSRRVDEANRPDVFRIISSLRCQPTIPMEPACSSGSRKPSHVFRLYALLCSSVSFVCKRGRAFQPGECNHNSGVTSENIAWHALTLFADPSTAIADSDLSSNRKRNPFERTYPEMMDLVQRSLIFTTMQTRTRSNLGSRHRTTRCQ